MANGILGQAELAAITETVIYEVPAIPSDKSKRWCFC